MIKNKVRNFKNLKLLLPLKNNRGIAILIATSCIVLITYFAMEVTYDTTVEYTINSQNLNRIKAYSAAKAGLDLALLRIKVFQKASSTFGKQMGSNAEMLNEIWRMPFAWPLPVPEELNALDKDNVKKLTKESLMDSNYIVTIEDEGSKIDINDLNSPIKALRESSKKQLLAIFTQKIKEDPVFAAKYAAYSFEDLIYAIQGWMSSTSKLANNQDKRAAYSELNSAAGLNQFYPPNRAFRTLYELRMVPQMTDEFFSLLEPVITIYGMKGINPNIANKDVLLSLDTGMTEEAVKAVMSRRTDVAQGGPFKDAKEFWDFVQSKGARIVGNTSDIPLIFDSVVNFRIRSIGQSGNATSEITAIVMDLSQAAVQVKTQLGKQNTPPAGGATPSGGTKPATPAGGGTPAPIAKGPPRIVYWSEK